MTLDPHPFFLKRHREDRREEPRVEVSLAAQLEHPDVRLVGRVEDISARGALFVTATMAPELACGTSVVLVWRSPADADAQRHGAVIVRCEDLYDGESESLAYSVRFDEPLASFDVDTGAA